ncbi:MAG TPA: 3-oxoacyl-[acyl-carrier-protein] synthase III C-terminal domain-containing protein [Polyangia bacterium]|nr:3-oxoacyl-[acyl-carrier-protein] synthase III C-terminal domain-containing protein [Polyangia bacterium]
MEKSIGIQSVAAYLPETVRTNDFWPAEVVAQWRERMASMLPRAEALPADSTEGMRLTMEALLALRDDPFQGARERRVVADDMLSSDMEVRAATMALEQAGVGVGDVDLLITHTMVPDYLEVNSASIVQHKLGVRRDCLSFGIDAVCTSFLLQLQLAEQMIRSGQARRALVTQSSACSRLGPWEQPFSAHLGDCATALVIGEVDSGRGFLGRHFESDGSLHAGFVATVPGKRWYDDGKVVAASEDKAAARKMQLHAADTAKRVIGAALEKSGVAPRDVRFIATHQPSVWLTRIIKQYCGLDNAGRVETFPWAANAMSSNIPLQLAFASREGLLSAGDPIAMFTVASGMTAASGIVRW